MQILLPKVPMKLMGFWIVKNILYVIHSLEYKFGEGAGGECKERQLLLHVVLCDFGGPVPPNSPQLPLDFSGTKVMFSILMKTLRSLQNLVFKIHN